MLCCVVAFVHVLCVVFLLSYVLRYVNVCAVWCCVVLCCVVLCIVDCMLWFVV